jgi:phosphate transporter
LHEVVESALPFTIATKDRINEALNRLVELYSKCVTSGDRAAAKQQLRLFQRENIAWERDTVWRQMIGRARTGDSPMAISVTKESDTLFTIPVPYVPIEVSKRLLSLLVAIAVFAVLLAVPTVEGGAASRCLAILIFSTILWASEVAI